MNEPEVNERLDMPSSTFIMLTLITLILGLIFGSIQIHHIITERYLDSIATGISLILEADTPTASTPWEIKPDSFKFYPGYGIGKKFGI